MSPMLGHVHMLRRLGLQQVDSLYIGVPSQLASVDRTLIELLCVEEAELVMYVFK